MGRDSGFIALETGIACGAELILLPETLKNIDQIKSTLKEILSSHRRSTLVVVAEGDETGGALKLSEQLGDDFKKYDKSEEHTSELQSRGHLVCRLLLEKKKVPSSERGCRTTSA